MPGPIVGAEDTAQTKAALGSIHPPPWGDSEKSRDKQQNAWLDRN